MKKLCMLGMAAAGFLLTINCMAQGMGMMPLTPSTDCPPMKAANLVRQGEWPHSNHPDAVCTDAFMVYKTEVLGWVPLQRQAVTVDMKNCDKAPPIEGAKYIFNYTETVGNNWSWSGEIGGSAKGLIERKVGEGKGGSTAHNETREMRIPFNTIEGCTKRTLVCTANQDGKPTKVTVRKYCYYEYDCIAYTGGKFQVVTHGRYMPEAGSPLGEATVVMPSKMNIHIQRSSTPLTDADCGQECTCDKN